MLRRYCYECASEVAGTPEVCPHCGTVLRFGERSRRFGLVYFLNRLDELVAAGDLDTATAERLRARFLGEIAVREAPSALMPAPARQPSPAADAWGDQTPNLLLYLGAFLVVVAALIFVNVSGQEISDELRLGLLVLGTAGFLVTGFVCHRIPRVLPAGRTFLAIGAVLVPIDFGAYYALLLRRSPLEAPEMWLAGSLIAAAFYARLAVEGFGAWYARLFFVATVSAVLAAAEQVGLIFEWRLLALAVLALAHLVAHARGARWPRLTSPLLVPSLILFAAVYALGMVLVASPPDTQTKRVGVLLGAVVATAYAALLARRWRLAALLATAGPVLVALALLYALRAAFAPYSLLLLSAAALALASGTVGARRVTLVWPTLAADLRIVGYSTLGLAFALLRQYEAERELATLVYVAGVVLLVAVEWWRERGGLPRPELRIGTYDLGRPHLLAAAASLTFGMRHALLWLPLFPNGFPLMRDPLGASTSAGALFVASLLTAAGLAVALRVRPAWGPAIALATLAGMALALITAVGDAWALAVIGETYVVLGLVATRRGGEPRALWISLVAGAASLFAQLEFHRVPASQWPVALVATSAALAALGHALRPAASAHARIAREGAIGGMVLATATGYSLLPPRGSAVDSEVWQATALALVGLAVLLALEARLRGAFLGYVGASASLLGAALMQIARLHPDDPQAYTAPIGAYCVGLALAVHRDRRLRDATPALEIVGALVLLAPPHLASWERDGFMQGLRVLATSFALLATGVILRRRLLVAAATAFVGLQAIRVLVDIFDRLPNWVVFGAAGALLLAIGFAILLKREAWLRWQSGIVRWWEGWGV